jgi:hypothetical protein
MVARVVPTMGDDQMDINRLVNNSEKVYSYRSIGDKRVYKDDNMRRLIMNYGAAYDRISAYFLENNEPQKARYYLDKAFQFISSDFSKDVRMVNLLIQTKQFDKAKLLTEQVMNKKQDEVDNIMFLCKLWLPHDPNFVYDIIQAGFKQFPDNSDLAYFTYDVGLETRMFGRSREILEQRKAIIGDYISPYIDSLSMYEKYFGGNKWTLLK